MKAILHLLKSEVVLTVSLILAIASACLVHPSREYISYIDFRTLAILLSLMIIMAGLQKLMVFRQLGELLITRVHTERGIALIFIVLCFFLSMFITNDVALITFVPFTIVVLSMAKRTERLIPVIVLETVAANLGSMMLPMGNPQNLYLYSLSGMSFGGFFLFMLPYGLASFVLIAIAMLILVPKSEVGEHKLTNYRRSKKDRVRLWGYLILFVISLLVVVRVLDYRIGFFVVLLVTLIMDIKTLRHVDTTLIFTFVFLFIFIGNLKQIPAVSDLLYRVVSGHEVPVAVLASQVISNVPAAILLSGFTDNIRGLILGTNLGGLGTLIASMASLISFKQYGNVANAQKGRYLLTFTIVNVAMLVILYIFSMI